jgi:hypothetical protein
VRQDGGDAGSAQWAMSRWVFGRPLLAILRH